LCINQTKPSPVSLPILFMMWFLNTSWKIAKLPKPQELIGEMPKKKKKKLKKNETLFEPSYTIYRLDFATKVKTEEGDKIIFPDQCFFPF
jgi:hypothetical protein